jgi:nitrate reductase NapA
MVHLLTGKQAKPGNGAFSLTGQPSACGTAREVGTFSHRLPADWVVDNPAHRAAAEKLWKLPANTLNPKVGSHITEMMRDLEDGKVKWLWVQVTNPFQSTANANHWVHAAREKDAFIVVSDAYPTLSCKVADLILPSAMIFEKWGAYGNSERRTQLWREQVAPPGDARSDVWQMMEFSKRFTLAEVWGRQAVPGLKAAGFDDGALPDVLAEAERLGYRRDQTLYEVLFATPEARAFIAIGFCGGFTTFSTFTYEAMRLLEDGEGSRAALYILASVLFSLGAAFVGLVAARELLALRR